MVRQIQDIILPKDKDRQGASSASLKPPFQGDNAERDVFIKKLSATGKRGKAFFEAEDPFKAPEEKIPRKMRKSKFLIGGGMLAVLAASGLILVSRFSSINIEIAPKQEVANVDVLLKAAAEPKNAELPLEVMQLKYQEKGTAKATGIRQVNKKAGGRIIIYNAYSSQPQSLVSGTRFEASSGKIYRISQPITLPGAKISGGKITASETEAAVYADRPGEDYNSDLTDFTIPGFQDPAKRAKIYARSKTKMEGGFIGEGAVIAESDIKNLESALKEKVQAYLSKTANPKPEEFLLYENGRKIIFDKLSNAPKAGDPGEQFELTASATLYGYLLKKADIEKALAEKYFSPDIASRIELADAQNLNFVIENSDATSLAFTLQGPAHFFWKIDEPALKNEITRNAKNLGLFFKSHPEIATAKVTYSPSWWRYIPKHDSRINIARVLDF